MRLGSRQPEPLLRFETTRPASPGELDEALVADARAGLTPADMVERRLKHLLEGRPARLGHADTGVTRTPGHQLRLILLPSKRPIQGDTSSTGSASPERISD